MQHVWFGLFLAVSSLVLAITGGLPFICKFISAVVIAMYVVMMNIERQRIKHEQ